jgi:hypothetical protein
MDAPTYLIADRADAAPIPPTWWGTYAHWLAYGHDGAPRMPEHARRELEIAATAVVRRLPAPGGASIRGAVIGAVQSGKTASMIGVAARALDTGFRLILVLSGLKNDLRLQTSLRFAIDLLQLPCEETDQEQRRYLHPLGRRALLSQPLRRRLVRLSPMVDMNGQGPLADALPRRFAESDDSVAVAVVKKNREALFALRMHLGRIGERRANPLPVLILDDECDEASVDGGDSRPTPEQIAALMAVDGIAASYLGYTATPQANLLQDRSNPLFPRDFVHVLRVPGREGTLHTYAVPGIRHAYTGGDVFYRWLKNEGYTDNDLVYWPTTAQGAPAGDDAALEEALLSFLVGGACRLALRPDLRMRGPKLLGPHMMLVHTDGRMEAHWQDAQRVVRLIAANAKRSPPATAIHAIAPASRIPPEWLARWLASDEPSWRAWWARHRRLHEKVARAAHEPVSWPEWEDVRARLPEVFEALKLKVMNQESDDGLSFRAPVSVQGEQGVPEDVCTILIGGNILSRGLTIEGLCTTFFDRWSNVPVSDTTVQRQRWFGYRGAHLEVCRLFAPPAVAAALAHMHAHDETLRHQLSENSGLSPTSRSFSCLHLLGGRSTSKAAAADDVELALSGTRVFVRRVQPSPPGASPDALAIAESVEAHAREVVAAVQADGVDVLPRDGGYARGRRLAGPIRAEVAADFLERLRFHDHAPHASLGGVHALLEHLGDALGNRLFTPSPVGTRGAVSCAWDPAVVAGYLRLWHHAWERRRSHPHVVSGLQANDGGPWVPRPPPSFNLVVRFGSRQEDTWPTRTLARSVESNGTIDGWGGPTQSSLGSQTPWTYAGDPWIDFPEAEQPLDHIERRRRVDEPGLLLLHVLARRDDLYHPVTYGVVVPDGGPVVASEVACPT